LCRGFESLLRYHASPTIFGMWKRLSAEEGGELAFDFDLEATPRRPGMNGHAMDQCAEVAHERSALVLGLSVICQDSCKPVYGFDIPIRRRRV
jgi:hypothetical protein